MPTLIDSIPRTDLQRRLAFTGTGRKTDRVQHTYRHRLDFVHDRAIEECRVRSGKAAILDIGIGADHGATPAITTRELAQRLLDRPQVKVFGLDISLSGIDNRIRTGEAPVGDPPYGLPNLSYIEADATQTLGVEAGSIDVVLCFNMLSYLDPLSRTKVFEQIYQALKPGGKFFFHFRYVNKPQPFLTLEKTDAAGSTLPPAWTKILEDYREWGKPAIGTFIRDLSQIFSLSKTDWEKNFLKSFVLPIFQAIRPIDIIAGGFDSED